MAPGSLTAPGGTTHSQFAVQPRSIIHVTAKLVSQGSRVFWNEFAHLHPKELCCLFLHDGTCAQQDLAPGQVLDGLGRFAETLLGQVGGVCDDQVEAVGLDPRREVQRPAVIVEDELLPEAGEPAVVLEGQAEQRALCSRRSVR